MESVDKIKNLINPLLDDAGLEVIELNLKHHGKVQNIELITDRACGGITIDECSNLNKKINDQLEKQGMGENYTVEVSSPGLDRPLRTARDFTRAIGRNVRFHLSEKINNKIELHGVVKDVDQNRIVIGDTSDFISIPLEKIHMAVQII